MKDRAFAEATEALAAGEIVGIFPEGRLTETGEMNPFRPGVAADRRGDAGAGDPDGAVGTVGQLLQPFAPGQGDAAAARRVLAHRARRRHADPAAARRRPSGCRPRCSRCAASGGKPPPAASRDAARTRRPAAAAASAARPRRGDVDARRQARLARVDLDDRRAVVMGIGRKQRRRIGLGRGADDQQHVAALRRPLDGADDVVGDALVEPDDIRPQRRAARRAGGSDPRTRVVPRRRRRAVARAAGALQVPVQLDDAGGAGALVQAVDVQRHDQALGNVPRRVRPARRARRWARCPRATPAAMRTSPRPASDCVRTPPASRARAGRSRPTSRSAPPRATARRTRRRGRRR